jgi:hypothetical protein
MVLAGVVVLFLLVFVWMVERERNSVREREKGAWLVMDACKEVIEGRKF